MNKLTDVPEVDGKYYVKALEIRGYDTFFKHKEAVVQVITVEGIKHLYFRETGVFIDFCFDIQASEVNSAEWVGPYYERS